MSNPSGASFVKRVAAILAVIGWLLMITTAAVPAGAAPPSGERPVVASLVSAAVRLSPPLARLEAGLQMVPRGSVLTDAGRLRPAADLGSWARSRSYRSVSSELAQGSAPDATTRDWTRCYAKGNGAPVICPDGYVEVN